MSTFEHTIANQFNSFLQDGEALVWTGKPKQGFLFQTMDVIFLPFMFFWMLITFTFIGVALFTNEPIIGLIVMPHLLIGIGLVYARFFLDKKRRKNTFYAISNKRILIRTKTFSENTQSIYFQGLTNIQLKEKKDGSGNIELDKPSGLALLCSLYPIKLFTGNQQLSQIEGVENVRETYDLIVKYWTLLQR